MLRRARFACLVLLLGGGSAPIAAQTVVDGPPPGPPLVVYEVEAPLQLETIVQTALCGHPRISAAAAQVAAARGDWVQAGLPPNPNIGFLVTEIGLDNASGQWGALVGQKVIRGGKLQLARAGAAQQTAAAERALAATRLRVRRDVRLAWYAAVAEERRVALARESVKIATLALQAAEELLRSQETSRVDVVRARIASNRAELALQTAEIAQRAARRGLAAAAGLAELPARPLHDALSAAPPDLSWEEAREWALAGNPALAAAAARKEQAGWKVARAKAEVVPDLNLQGSVQYDDGTGDTFSGFQATLPLPLWNRNQGGIARAEAERSAAAADQQRLALALEAKLADVYRRYVAARARSAQYSGELIPSARESLELVQEGYRQGEFAYLVLLNAQETLIGTQREAIDALRDAHQALAEIEGLQLDEGR